MQKEVIIYKTASKKEPLTEWVESIKDNQIRVRIKTRLARVVSGNLGDHK
jgi:putative component of toxin-antitoxin plasmid stabilization module